MFEVKELTERPRPGDVVQLPSGQLVRVRHVGIPWMLPPRKVCNDPECPWHGHLKVRGQLIKGVVAKVKPRVVTIVHEWLHYDQKYMRYERRRRKIHARLPPCIDVKVGDVVYIGETRPLSKTIAHVALGKEEDVVSVKPKVIKGSDQVAT